MVKIRRKRAILVRSALLLVLSLIVVVFAVVVDSNLSWGWFASNSSVTGNDLQVAVRAENCDLLVSRTTEYDRMKGTSPLTPVPVYTGVPELKTDFTTNGYSLTADSTSVSPLAFERINEYEVNERDTYTNQMLSTRFLMPGAYGKLEFYLRPCHRRIHFPRDERLCRDVRVQQRYEKLRDLRSESFSGKAVDHGLQQPVYRHPSQRAGCVRAGRDRQFRRGRRLCGADEFLAGLPGSYDGARRRGVYGRGHGFRGIGSIYSDATTKYADDRVHLRIDSMTGTGNPAIVLHMSFTEYNTSSYRAQSGNTHAPNTQYEPNIKFASNAGYGLFNRLVQTGSDGYIEGFILTGSYNTDYVLNRTADTATTAYAAADIHVAQSFAEFVSGNLGSAFAEEGKDKFEISATVRLLYRTAGAVPAQFPGRNSDEFNRDNGVTVSAASNIAFSSTTTYSKNSINLDETPSRSYYSETEIESAMLNLNPIGDSIGDFTELGINALNNPPEQIDLLAVLDITSIIRQIDSYDNAYVTIKLLQKQSDGTYGSELPIADYIPTLKVGANDATNAGTYYYAVVDDDDLEDNGVEITLPELHLTVLTGDDFQTAGYTYGNFRVVVSVVLRDGTSECAISLATNYVIYTNAKVFPSYIS